MLNQLSKLLFGWLLNATYLTLMLLASPWIVWSALRHGKYREGFAQKLLGRVPRCSKNCPRVWLHAVSVGEVNLLETTLQELKQCRPDWELVISTTTKTGYDLACRKYAEYTVFYCPLDFSWAVKKAMQRIRPNLLVLAELELWPNLIQAAKANQTKVAIINGRLSDNSYRGYRRIRLLISALLQNIDLIAAQSKETAERFWALGAQQVKVTGSLKFDGAVIDRNNLRTQQLRQLANISEDQVVFLAGSTQEPEEKYALEIFQTLSLEYPQLRLILVPRHPERFDEIAQLLDRSGISWQRRSQLTNESSFFSLPPSALLIDTIGELGAWWGAASIGFVGGSFGSRGGQNMLEPAAYGVATSFGPNTRNFRDIVARLLAVEGAQRVHNREELEQFVRRALTDSTWAQQMGQRARQLVLNQQGATRQTIKMLLPLVNLPTNLRQQTERPAA